jgi:ribonuclease HII
MLGIGCSQESEPDEEQGNTVPPRMEQHAAPVAGVDEAGRGCLAGPVVAAAVVLPEGAQLPGLNDSKRLSPATRTFLAERIKAEALAWSLGLSWPREIERINILQATQRAMLKAVRLLRVRPAFVVVDGSSAPDFALPQSCIPGGDGCVPSISAASIVAKTFRDALMEKLDSKYPGYGLKKHKGYGTKAHIESLRQLGPSPLHRRTFGPVSQCLEEGQLWLPGI